MSAIHAAKQSRREALGRQLQDAVPRQPTQRLVTLLQQAVKWQSYTGQLPRIRQWWDDDDDSNDNDKGDRNDKSKTKKKRKRKEFDLVLGEVSAEHRPKLMVDADAFLASKHITNDYATISFGKKATCESAVFLPDGSTTGGIVTGSSDGLMEVYDLRGNLRTDLPYQARDEFMGHDAEVAVTALAISNDGQLLVSGAADGTVHVWRLDTGQRLRTIESSASSSVLATPSKHTTGISCLSLAPHGSHVLVAQGNDCREFGLRSGRMLKEFRGHTSYLTSCAYRLIARGVHSSDNHDESPEQLIVATSSGDGSVRIWNGTTADLIHVFHPVSLGQHRSGVGSSLVTAADTTTDDCPAVHGLHPLHTPRDTWIVVPRGRRAFLVHASGQVVRIFENNKNVRQRSSKQ